MAAVYARRRLRCERVAAGQAGQVLQPRAEDLDLGRVPVAGAVLDAGVVLEEARVVGRGVPDDVAVLDAEAVLQLAHQLEPGVDLLRAVQDLPVHPVAVLARALSWHELDAERDVQFMPMQWRAR